MMADDFKLPEPGSTEAPKDELPKPDSPPRKAVTSKPATPTARASSLEKRLTEMYVSIGTMILVADPVCGLAVVQAAPDTAAALDTLAKENRAVKRALEKMLQGGAWGGVLMAHFPIVTTVLAHHNMLPAQAAEMLHVTPKAKAKPTLRTVPTEDGQGVGNGTDRVKLS